MKTLGKGAPILAACAGLLVLPAAWSEGSGAGSHEVRVDKGETLSASAWQHRRERAGGSIMFGISRAAPEIFPGGNLGNERADERGAFRAYREPGGWYQKREDAVQMSAPIVQSPR